MRVTVATLTPASWASSPAELGTLADGAHADLLVLDADPLEDIGALADPGRVRHVVQAGRVVSG
ncbi:amidohydrolase family protein [Nonomuraea sp. NPDC002799]